MSTKEVILPDIVLDIIDDRREFQAVVEVPTSEGVISETIIKKDFSELMKTIGEVTVYINKYKNINTNKHVRGERAAAMIGNISDVIDVVYKKEQEKVVIHRKSMDLGLEDSVKLCAGLELNDVRISQSREDGILFVIEYNVKDYAPEFPDEVWDDVHNKLFERTPYESTRIDVLKELDNEYFDKSGIITDSEIYQGQPRIAGTSINPHKITAMIKEDEYTDEQIIEYFHPNLTIEDINTCIDYSEGNQKGYEEYTS